MDADVGGQLHGISLDSFLQMAQMERTTCTLNVSAKEELGFLFILNGELIDAQTGILDGSEAAYLIISWDNSTIEIENKCDRTENKIKQPLMNVLMEGMRVRDENKEAKPSGQPQGDPVQQQVSTPSAPPQVKPDIDVEEEFSSSDLSKPADKIDPKDVPPDSDAKPVERKRVEKKVTISTVPGKKQPLTVIVFAVGLVLIVAAIVIYMMLLKPDAYQSVLAKVDNQPVLAEKLKLLEEFKNSQGKKADTTDVDQKIKGLHVQIENRDFKAINNKIEKLPVDNDFEKNVTALYNQYLVKHPGSNRTAQVKQLITDIPFRMDDDAFKKLKLINEGDYIARVLAYRSYLSIFPDGRHRKTVSIMISELGEIYYGFLKNKISSCNHNKNWESCIDICDQFIANFRDHSLIKNVVSLQKQLQGREDLARLNEKKDLAGNDYEVVKNLLLTYLKENPDSNIKTDVLKNLEQVNKNIATENNWKALADYSINEKIDVFTRIKKLQSYINQNPSDRHLGQAQTLLKQLQSEKTSALQQRKTQAAADSRKEKIQKDKIRIQQERARIQRIREQIKQQLQKSGGRYITAGNGTFTDTKTGKMWCLLDSQLDRGECMNYQTALKYAEALKTGGYGNWRIPTAGELAGIYKSKPFFPSTGNGWYWTSETFIKGYHKIASIVTTKKETSFKKEQIKQDQCGAVRAIRP